MSVEKPIDDPTFRNEVVSEVKKKSWATKIIVILILITLLIALFLLVPTK